MCERCSVDQAVFLSLCILCSLWFPDIVITSSKLLLLAASNSGSSFFHIVVVSQGTSFNLLDLYDEKQHSSRYHYFYFPSFGLMKNQWQGGLFQASVTVNFLIGFTKDESTHLFESIPGDVSGENDHVYACCRLSVHVLNKLLY